MNMPFVRSNLRPIRLLVFVVLLTLVLSAGIAPRAAYAVGGTASSTNVVGVPNPSLSGQAVTFTATVSGPAGVPTGTVQFLDDGGAMPGAACNAVNLNGSGQATCTEAALPVGSHVITANYSGDATYAISSGTTTQKVQTSVTTVVGVPNPSNSGGSVTFTATVTHVAGPPTPTGNVQFLDDGVAMPGATCNAVALGVTDPPYATCTTSALPIGSHVITANFISGDANYSSNSGTTTQNVSPVPATGASIGVSGLSNHYHLTDTLADGTPGVQPGTVTITGTGQFFAASVTISGGYFAGDSLGLNPAYAPLSPPFVATYTAPKLLLTRAVGATASQIQDVLNAVRFTTTNNTAPSLSTERTFTYSIDENVDAGNLFTCPTSGQGHQYQVVDIPPWPTSGWDWNWNQARTSALASYYLGYQGYLVHIANENENECVYQHQLNLGHNGWGGEPPHVFGAWIGLYAPDWTGPYVWIDGPYEVPGYWRWGPGGGLVAPYPKWEACAVPPYNDGYVLMFDADSSSGIEDGDPKYWGNYCNYGTPVGQSRAGSYIIEYGGASPGYTRAGGPFIGTATVNVVKAESTTTVISSPASPKYGQAFTLTATVYHVLPADGIPTGHVMFKRNGVAIAGCENVTLGGVYPLTATCTPTVPGIWNVPGSPHTVTVDYWDDVNFNFLASTGTLAGGGLTIIKANTTTTIITTPPGDYPDPSGIGQCYNVPYTVTPAYLGTPTGTVTVSDGTDSSTAAVGAGSCTLISTTAGAKNLTATYNGDANFNASPASATEPHTVFPAPEITSLAPDMGTAGDPAFVLIVNGKYFTRESVVEWDGSARPTTFISATELRANITAADVATPWVYDVTVFAGCSAPRSNPMPYFNNEPGVTVHSFAVQTGADPTASTDGVNPVTASATGTGTLVVAKYNGNPASGMLLGASGLYYDVHSHPPGAFSEVIIQFCGLTYLDYIYFWNGVQWVQASNQIYNFGTGCWIVTVNDLTTPNLTDLEGAIFGGGKGPGTSTSFADVPPSYWAHAWITRLAEAGITNGCALLKYCPENNVTRSEMAIFLERGIHGAAYTPPPATGLVFSDVPLSFWAASWIEKLYADGITNGCVLSPLAYCPNSNVTRAEMAKFLLLAKHGSTYIPPAVGTSTGFADVTTSYWAAAWIKQLAAEGITSGCGSGNYCPNQPVTRAEMAKFLVITFNLP